MADQAQDIPREGAAVAVFDDHASAERAVRLLREGGFPLERLSIVGKDGRSEEHVIGFYSAGDQVKYWGRLGAFWGALGGLLNGSAFLMVPAIGPVLVFGPLAHWIMAGLEGAAVVGGVSALGAGLVSLGVPRTALAQYESALRGGRLLVVAGGTARDVERARDVLRRVAPGEVHDYARVPVAARMAAVAK